MSDAMDFMPALKGQGTNRVLRVVFNTDLRNSHDGLSQLAKDFKIDTARLKPGEYIVFINTAKTALKLYAAGQVIAYFRMPTHRKMDMRVISLIPRFFNGRELKYDDALRELITKQWGQRT